MWWDDERIKWYREAAERTVFHSSLASELETFLKKDERILEIGCGLGYVSEILKKHGYDIKATDIEEAAITEAERRSSLDIFSILDADTPLPCSDTLLMIFFGRIRENGNLERYLSNTGRIIYVLSEHRGQSDTLRKKEGEPEDTIAFLDSIPDIRYQRYPFSADFSQYLESAEDALKYIRRMYGEEKEEEYMSFLQKKDDGMIFPNTKHTSIFIIEKRRRLP